MFKSRRRAVSNPPPNRNTTPTPAAALAASQAFLKNATSNASLSSSAAAAALRSHTTSPVPVASVQTKRMQRRGSTASAASAASAGPAPGLRRQSSSGSMTERTFRSPSPARGNGTVAADSNAPPVPPIPRDMSPAPQHKRATSAQASTVRLPPEPRKQGGRGMSVDRGTPAAPDRTTRTPSQASELDRDASQRSLINFSRPISPRITPPTSPPPTRTSHSGWFTAAVTTDQKPRQDIQTSYPINSTALSAGLTGLEQSAHDAANKPVAKKKKAASGVEGSHLAGGNMAGKPTGTTVDGGVSAPARTHSPPAQHTNHVPTSPQSSSLSSVSTESENPGFQTRPATLGRHPSTVMEDPEIEDETERFADADQPVKPRVRDDAPISSEAPAKATGAKTQARRASAASSRSLGFDTGHERPQSLSPGRSAHFALNAVDASNHIRHQPPGRSVSPAKSALKHSPSSSIRTSSPVALHAARAPSDAGSDTGSYEGARPTQKKKKGVRVSFDENIREDDSSSPNNSPGGLDSSRWSGRTLQGMDDDLDTVMKPRPALPSFGSIRRERPNVDEEVAEKVTETIPSSMSNSASTMVEPMEASGDYVAGGVLAQDFAAKQRAAQSNAPLPPDVTSVEGSGYVSDDTASSLDEDLESVRGSDTNPIAKVLDGEAPGIANISANKPTERLSVEEAAVPQIAVQPATPGTDGDNQEPTFEMPGAWSDLDDESLGNSLHTTVSNTSQPREDQSLNTESPRAGQFQVLSAKDMEPIEPRQNLEQYLRSVQEDSSSDDDSSVYSDAAEDLSEMEGGFASLDAMVESPIVPPARGPEGIPPPESPLAAATVKKDRGSGLREESSKSKDWNGLSTQKKRELEDDANSQPSPPTAARQLEPAPILKPAKPKKKKAAVFAEQVSVAPATTSKPMPLPQARQAPQPKKPALRTSMRADKPDAPGDASPGTQMRKSMRTSMRDAPIGLAASRHSDVTAEKREPKGALQKKKIPLGATRTAAAPPRRSAGVVTPAPANRVSTMPALSRIPSNGSDASDSSFKRTRRASASATEGRYTMRRSMRGASVPSAGTESTGRTLSGPTMRPTSPPSAPRSSRLSVRSLSPNGSMFGRRKPMMSTQDSMLPTMRAQGPPPTKSSRFSLAGKPSKAKTGPVKPASSSRFQSRYDASSDEEDGGGLPTFRSRFADSDDEDDVPELPSGLAPVRGIPRKSGDSDAESTDLEDEETDTEGPSAQIPVPSSKDIGQASVPPIVTSNGNASNGDAMVHQGSVPSKGSLRDSKYAGDSPLASPRKEKRGFFKLGKKRDSSLPRPSTPPEASLSPTGTGSPSSPSRNPRLQRRTQQLREGSDSWPLPPPIPDDAHAAVTNGRPMTSDGVVPSSSNPLLLLRPTLGKRQSTGAATTETAPIVATVRDAKGRDVVLGRGGKKKKFPMLRKAFGLKD